MGDGTETIRRMERTFEIFGPDSDQTISAESQLRTASRLACCCSLSRSASLSRLLAFNRSLCFVRLSDVCALMRQLGYRPDAAIVASKFAELNRRLAKATASDSSASAVADEGEMHLHSFMDLVKQSNEQHDASASSPSAIRSSGGARSHLPLDSDLQDLQRSLELIALSAPPSEDAIRSATKAAGFNSASSARGSLHSSPSPSLLSIHALRQRMRVLPLSKRLSDAELSGLISEAGVLDAAGMPAPHLDSGSSLAAAASDSGRAASAATSSSSAGFIDLRALVQRMQANRINAQG